MLFRSLLREMKNRCILFLSARAARCLKEDVPKKRFKRAVKRNRVKRQVREAYRKNKHILLDALKDSGRKIAIAFIWLDNELHESADVEAKVVKLLQLTAERLA